MYEAPAESTYLLEELSLDDISRIHEKHPKVFEVNPATGRGLLVASEAPPDGERRIARILPGDNSDIVKRWLAERTIDLLYAEHERRRPTEEDRASCLDAWQRAHEHLGEVQRRANELAREKKRVALELKEAKQVECDASRALVLTHGRARVWVGGVQFEAVCDHDTIRYRRCRPFVYESSPEPRR